MSSAPAIDVYADHLLEQGEDALVQVVYSSLAVSGPEGDADILAVSRRNNQAVDITGLLIRDGAWFLQVLEGPVAAVPATMRRIEADPRHRDINIRLVRITQARRFGEWTMCSPTLDRVRFDALVESLERDRSETDRLIADFIAEGAWPEPPKPRRKLGASLKAAFDEAADGPFSFIVYTSLTHEQVPADTVDQWVERNWQRNAAAGITGIMLYDDGNVLEYLEGRADAVASVWDTILNDRRHHSVAVLDSGETPRRLFSGTPLEMPSIERPLFADAATGAETAGLRKTVAALVRGMR